MAVIDEPRPLNASERQVLERILSADVPGFAELRGQLQAARVVTRWGTNSASVDLQVPRSEISSQIASGVLPIDAPVLDSNRQFVGEIIVWVDSGYLAGIEYAWYTDEPPSQLPLAEQIDIEEKK